MKKRTAYIIAIMIVACSLLGIHLLGGLYADDNDSGSYEIKQATEIGVSQSYSPDIQEIICENQEFIIKELTPELFSVFALERAYTYDDYGYQKAIDNAIIEIGRDNVVDYITAVTSYYSQGSETRHLLVMVSPRNASTNYNHSGNNS